MKQMKWLTIFLPAFISSKKILVKSWTNAKCKFQPAICLKAINCSFFFLFSSAKFMIFGICVKKKKMRVMMMAKAETNWWPLSNPLSLCSLMLLLLPSSKQSQMMPPQPPPLMRPLLQPPLNLSLSLAGSWANSLLAGRRISW